MPGIRTAKRSGYMTGSTTGGISYLKKPVKVAICVLSMTGHRVGDRLESSLTSMELPGIKIGAQAADQLIDLIERDEKKDKHKRTSF